MPNEARSRWWWLAALLLILSVLAAGVALTLGEIAPDYETIMMLGQIQSGKLRVVLWAVAILLVFLAMLAATTIFALRRDSTIGQVVMGLAWLAALPVIAVIFVVGALNYDQQPETHEFSVNGQDYILSSQVGFLIAADDTYLHLYRKDGRVYREVDLRLGVADTTAFNRNGFSLGREGEYVWIVYVSGADESVRVQIP